MASLKDKVVLITGSSEGIGRGTAFQFAKEGAAVIITYRKDEKEAKKAGEKCKELGAADVFVLQLDVTDNKSIKTTVKKIVQKFKHIDILINNAGVLAWKPLVEQTFEDIERQVRTNLEGLIKMTREAVPHVKECIINIASGAGKSPYPSLSTYCATKFGVRGFTQTIAFEFPKLKIYVVNPGMTATRMTNFKGVPAEKVAELILNTAKGKYKTGASRDIDVWDYL